MAAGTARFRLHLVQMLCWRSKSEAARFALHCRTRAHLVILRVPWSWVGVVTWLDVVSVGERKAAEVLRLGIASYPVRGATLLLLKD